MNIFSGRFSVASTTPWPPRGAQRKYSPFAWAMCVLRAIRRLQLPPRCVQRKRSSSMPKTNGFSKHLGGNEMPSDGPKDTLQKQMVNIFLGASRRPRSRAGHPEAHRENIHRLSVAMLVFEAIRQVFSGHGDAPREICTIGFT